MRILDAILNKTVIMYSNSGKMAHLYNQFDSIG